MKGPAIIIPAQGEYQIAIKGTPGREKQAIVDLIVTAISEGRADGRISKMSEIKFHYIKD